MWGQGQPLEPLTARGVPHRQWSQSPSQEDNRDHVSCVHPREKSQDGNGEWDIGQQVFRRLTSVLGEEVWSQVPVRVRR